MCEEYPELREESKEDIYSAAKMIISLEEKFIDKMFEMGDLENLSAKDLKNFIIKRTNEKLVELGYQNNFDYDEESAMVLSFDWWCYTYGFLRY
jgi:ribonucleoside-diphosphate reductase beta chain